MDRPPLPSSPRVDPLLAGCVAILAVSTASLFIQAAVREGMPPLVVAGLRLGIATLVLLPLAVWRRRDELRALSRGELGLALVSSLFLAVHFATWIASFRYTSLASSVVIVCTVPLWIGLLAPWLLGERTPRVVFLGALIAMGGALIVAWTDGTEGSDPLWGNFLALLGSWAAAGYLMAGRRLRARVSLLGYVSVTYAGAALWLLLAIHLQRHSLLGHPTAAYGWCLALAVVPQLIGHSIFNWSLRYLPATTVAVLVLGEPVGAILLNLALLGQPPTQQEVIGGAIILMGVGLASRGR